ncbi:venom dipeptidyl peptidase 4 [Colletes gigas]|uniref:venom dipeptidyl peptidase 4 n=1 Tax=Colletes gigas TaxID=935657 RepID=UPI001C9B9D4D|nr:venom dipeptidyl peptidase 4 [Colletes gigas]
MYWNEVLRLLVLQVSLAVLVAGKSISRMSNGHEAVEESDLNGNTVPFTLEETYDQSFRATGFNGSWISNTEILYNDDHTGDIRIFDATSGTSSIFLDSSILSPYDKPSLSISFDRSYVLIGYDFVNGFRYSTFQKFDVYNVKSKQYITLADGERLALGSWSPTRNAVVYVLQNDIYYQTFSETGSKVRRLTHTGVPGVIYNGVPDWVYEEEVLDSAVALWFSPNGDYLAFASYNDTEVKDVVMLYYGTPGSMKNQYPTEVKIKYPKAGSPNPIVSLTVASLINSSVESRKLEPPVNVVGVDNILYTVSWGDNEYVAATWTNRVQTKAQTVYYSTGEIAFNDVETEVLDHMYQEELSGWLRILPSVFSNRYAIVLQLEDSGTDAGRFVHAIRFKYDTDGRLLSKRDLTPVAAEVMYIAAVNKQRGILYYVGTGVGKPTHRNLYSVPLDGSREPECVSCNVPTPEGHTCSFVYAYFSDDSSHYTLNCAGPDPSTVMIFDTASHRLLYTWERNRSLRQKLATRMQPLIKNLQIRVNGYDCNVRLYLPHDFDDRKSYPLLINVYAGPNTVRITEANTHGFESYMTTNRSVIYGHIDGRGSAYKGSKMLFEIYRRMGTVEIEDQIAVTRALQDTYAWIDGNRTAIWGWSYGGFATAMTLATDKDSVFKCGISVAPVSSWIYYDSIYTERYMGLPTLEDNLRGYNGTDVNRKVEGIRGKKFLLIHGTGDDNVHYQQSLALNKALVQKVIVFELQTYTDEAHGLTGVSPHLYHTMDRFWSNCLGYSRDH